MKVGITAIAHYVPETIVGNEELSAKYPAVGTADDIFGKTHIKERRYADISSVDMATIAVERVIEQSGIAIDAIDGLLVGTLTPDYFFPSTAAHVMKNLGLKGYGFDVNSACPSFIYGMRIAESEIKAGQCERIIVCGVDKMSATLNGINYKTGVLFGDAAAAVLLEKKEHGINGSSIKVIPDNLHDVFYHTPFSGGGGEFQLDGKSVYANGVQLSADFIREYCRNTPIENFDHIVPHQANGRMIRDIAQQLEIPQSKFALNLERFGNTASASVPLCLSQKLQEGEISRGDRVLLMSFGAGYSLGLIDIHI